MSIPIDLSEAGNVILPSGIYNATIVKAELKTSARTGNPYINWEFDVVSDDEDYSGKKLWAATVTKGRGAFKLVELLDALGVDEDSRTAIEPDEFLGMSVNIRVGIREYTPEGSTTPRESNDCEEFLPA